MLVIPAVDIRRGKCVRLVRGEKGKETVYGDPVEMAIRWEREGAMRLHVVDLDGAFEGVPRNLEVIRQICSHLTIPVEVGGGIRDMKAVDQLLEVGATWVILGTVLVEHSGLAEEICNRHSSNTLAAIDARGGRVAIGGWEKGTAIGALDLAIRCQEMGVSAIIYTDISKDGTLTGLNIEETERVARCIHIPLIASGGVSSLKDILAVAELEPLGVEGVIVGKAFYDSRLDLKRVLVALGRRGVQSQD